MPIASAFVLTAFASRWLFPEAPRLLWAAVGVIALVPTILMLRRALGRRLAPVLCAIVIFYVIDQVRAVVASLDAVPRLLLIAEMTCGLLFLAWYMRFWAPHRAEAPSTVYSRLLRVALWGAFAFCAATAVANMLGYVTLSNLVGNAVLSSAYYGLILVALVIILDGIIALALAVRPLNLLSMVKSHAPMLAKRVGLITRLAALVLWLQFFLERLAIRDMVVARIIAIFEAEAALGSVRI